MGRALQVGRWPLLLFFGLIFSADCQTPEVGIQICGCYPAVYEFTIDFSLTCNDQNVGGPGINQTTCLTDLRGQEDQTGADLTPVVVSSVSIFELGPNSDVIAQTINEGSFLNGSTFQYTSIIATEPELLTFDTLPRGIQLVFVGSNSENRPVVNTFGILYTNDCGVFPLIQEGQVAGWSRFTDLGDPPEEVCPLAAVPSDEPTGAPSGVDTEFPTTTPTRAPTLEPGETAQPVPPTRNPTKSPTRSPTRAPSRSPTRSPTRPPTRAPATPPTITPTSSRVLPDPPTCPPTSGRAPNDDDDGGKGKGKGTSGKDGQGSGKSGKDGSREYGKGRSGKDGYGKSGRYDDDYDDRDLKVGRRPPECPEPEDDGETSKGMTKSSDKKSDKGKDAVVKKKKKTKESGDRLTKSDVKKESEKGSKSSGKKESKSKSGKGGKEGSNSGKSGKGGDNSGKSGKGGSDSGKSGKGGNDSGKSGKGESDSGKSSKSGNDSGKSGKGGPVSRTHSVTSGYTPSNIYDKSADGMN